VLFWGYAGGWGLSTGSPASCLPGLVLARSWAAVRLPSAEHPGNGARVRLPRPDALRLPRPDALRLARPAPRAPRPDPLAAAAPRPRPLERYRFSGQGPY